MAAVSAAAAAGAATAGICRSNVVELRSSCRASASKSQVQLAARSWQKSRSHGRISCTAPRASSQPKTEIELQDEENKTGGGEQEQQSLKSSSSSSAGIQKELNKAVTKTAATFAPRASTASKNPAVPGSTLYKIFESQAYVMMAVGGALSFNLIFPSDQADIWRLMGMWSIWMFTIPSLRARDCSKKEKEALNYLFLLVPLINVTLPIFWKSFAAVYSADVVAFFSMYAWKMGWLSDSKEDV